MLLRSETVILDDDEFGGKIAPHQVVCLSSWMSARGQGRKIDISKPNERLKITVSARPFFSCLRQGLQAKLSIDSNNIENRAHVLQLHKWHKERG